MALGDFSENSVNTGFFSHEQEADLTQFHTFLTVVTHQSKLAFTNLTRMGMEGIESNEDF